MSFEREDRARPQIVKKLTMFPVVGITCEMLQ